jgi:hypothetical protein
MTRKFSEPSQFELLFSKPTKTDAAQFFSLKGLPVENSGLLASPFISPKHFSMISFNDTLAL